MHLSRNDISQYVSFVFSSRSEQERQEIIFKMKEKSSNESYLERYFVYKNGKGEIEQAIIFHPWQKNQYYLHILGKGEALLKEVIEFLKNRGAKLLLTRIIHKNDYKEIVSILEGHSFFKKGVRFEYKTLLNELPDERSSPLRWFCPLDEGQNIEEMALLLKQVATDDPDFDQDEDALSCIKSYFDEETLYKEVDCLQVGYLEDKDDPVCFIVAQLEKSTGWSRITYMGILPKYRRQGFGLWVQRHGFTMMRQQGGTLYHGGTHQDNVAMQRVFEQNRCKFSHKVSEFNLYL